MMRSWGLGPVPPARPPNPTHPPALRPRSGLLLSPGGEFAFVLFGEAVSRGIMGAALAKELYLVVALRWGAGRRRFGCSGGGGCGCRAAL